MSSTKKLEKTLRREKFALVSDLSKAKVFDPAEPMIVNGVANMAGEDRVGDVILSTAWVLDNYKANPVVLFNHDYDVLVGSAITVEPTERGLECSLQVGNPNAGYPLTTDQIKVRSLLAQGILKAFSVGFIPLECDYDETNGRFIITKAELLEISLVTVPCQQESLVNEVKHFPKKEKVMDEEMKKRFDSIDEAIKACNDKITQCYDKLNEGGSSDDNSTNTDTTVEQSLRAEIATLKQENDGLKKVIDDFSTLI